MSFFEIFAPGLRHLREERSRQRHDATRPRRSDPPFEIDLDAGTARIVLPATKPTRIDPTTSDPTTSDTAKSDTAESDTAPSSTPGGGAALDSEPEDPSSVIGG